MVTEDRDFKACLARAKTAPPPDACPVCRENRWWIHPVTGRRICGTCHPDPEGGAGRKAERAA
ncbi:MAG: hypothetical protein GX493_06160 [Firmicutes bacterium]|nr:hypothetical protein [Bacillota bacterium]